MDLQKLSQVIVEVATRDGVRETVIMSPAAGGLILKRWAWPEDPDQRLFEISLAREAQAYRYLFEVQQGRYMSTERGQRVIRDELDLFTFSRNLIRVLTLVPCPYRPGISLAL